MKLNYKKVSFTLYTILFLGLYSCYAQTPKEEKNSEDNIAYSSTSDKDNIYVELSTSNVPTMLSMLHRGFYVYFDVKGKKKRNISVQYPSEVTQMQRQSPRKSRDNNTEQERGEREEGERKGPDISTLLTQMPRKANYNTPNSEEEFHLDINSLGIKISYSYNAEDNILQYNLAIPKKRISDIPSKLPKLSIGVVTSKMENEEKESPNVSFGGGGQGSRGGGGRGGQGGPPGGGQGGGQGGRGGSQTGQPQRERPQEINLNIWFKANLVE